MLHDLLAVNIYKLIVLFARLGTVMMLLPGLASTVVYARARLVLALLVAFLLVPTLGSKLPDMPPDPLGLFLLILREATVGAFLGMVAQILMVPMDFAGSTIGYAVGLTNMFTYDPITEQQSQLMTGFLNMVAVALVFVTDSHHLMLRAIADSYALFAPDADLLTGDLSQHLTRVLGDSFVTGFRLASPLLVFSLAFNTGLGLLNRLVPQIPVYFVGLPIQIMGGLAILAISLPAIMLGVINHLQDGLAPFLGDR